MKIKYCASCYIVNLLTQEVLLVKHKKFNKWVQAGGHINENETPLQAVLRELDEELSFEIEKDNRNKFYFFGRFEHFHKDKVMIDYAFVYLYDNQDIGFILDLDESSALKWFTIQELKSNKVFQDIQENVENILNKYKKDK